MSARSAIVILLGMASLVAGCAAPPVSQTITEAPPAATPAPPPDEVAAPTLPSNRIATYYSAIEARRISEGLLRTDAAARDLPVSARSLTENFVRIALFDEYTFVGDRLIERETPAPLRRWQAPVQMHLRFGDTVAPAIQGADRAFVTRLSNRLASLTGHSVSMTGNRAAANFHIFVVTEEDRMSLGPELERVVPGIDAPTLRIITQMPPTLFCMVLAFARSDQDVYTDAIAIIRAEHPNRTRQACYYEELAQGMGLPNDSPTVRPSIFNDTGEFAVLTNHDEQLLRILYDPRLRPGMREREARPIVGRIAAELLGGES